MKWPTARRMATVLFTFLIAGCQSTPPFTAQPTPISSPELRLTRKVMQFRGNAGQVGGPLVTAAAQFASPLAVAEDQDGNLYVTDGSHMSIRRIAPDGMVTTLAGGGMGFKDGTGAEARFMSPWGIAVGPEGDLYVADSSNGAIRKVTREGVVTTLAGNGTLGFLDGQGTAARFNFPGGIAVDATGTLYVADTWNNAIRKVSPSGEVTTWVGGSQGLVDGTGRDAKFDGPTGLAIAGDGTLYVSDSKNNCIRKVSSSGQVTTVAGGATSGLVDGNRETARFKYPVGLTLDGTGNLYVVDVHNHAIRRVAPDGGVTTLAGGAPLGAFSDGPGSDARFSSPLGITMGSAGSLFIGDGGNARVRLLSPTGEVSTYAGGVLGTTDGPRIGTNFGNPSAMALDAAGNLLVTAYKGREHLLYKVTQAGDVSVVAGGGTGFADGVGQGAKFDYPSDVVVGPNGDIFIADSANSRIRKVGPDGMVSSLAGSTGPGHADGQGSAAKFVIPFGLALDPEGNLYVADTRDRAIRKVSPSGHVTTLAGGPGSAPGASPFNLPGRLVRDDQGNLLVGDLGNHQILKVTANGNVSVLAGEGEGVNDGIGSAAQFGRITGMGLDASGLLYVIEGGNTGVRVVSPTGEVRTLQLQDETTGKALALEIPTALSVDAEGQLWVAQRDGTIFVIH